LKFFEFDLLIVDMELYL